MKLAEVSFRIRTRHFPRVRRVFTKRLEPRESAVRYRRFRLKKKSKSTLVSKVNTIFKLSSSDATIL